MDSAVDGSIDISIRSYDEQIQQAYRSLFPGDPQKSPELLDWRFQANPHGLAKFAVAVEGSEIVGMIALVPTRLVGSKAAMTCYQAIDTVVHPSFRGRGLFVRMGAASQDEQALGGSVLWGFPNANAARGWYGRLGWTNLGAVPLLMRPLRSGFLLGKVHPKLRSIDFPLVRNRNVQAQVYADGRSFAEDFGPLWERVSAEFGIAVDRNADWMRWRLFAKPGEKYRCVGLKSGAGDLECFVATKIADKHGARICYVMEAIGIAERRADLTSLLVGELARAACEGAEIALAWCPRAAPNHVAHRKAGFVPVPPRFRPIEINFGAKSLSRPVTTTVSDWYLSFLDSDTN